eukprot:CAMPEP_0173086248 /NCGR_PEP_ID=MMETSP1102-20130122/22587_1 /TAXON_ID=49646 /ORGANISM="Geminigera sp., Strain Caron Lab Isolate" /LENGTH=178 /DNA_ID=CAMNT_0013966647 /DNA_START=29 /DNA_END=565 /DNA_ORIENTATION=-
MARQGGVPSRRKRIRTHSAKWTLAPQHAYFRVALLFEKQSSAMIDLRLVKSVILASVHSLYGDVGLPGEVDVLEILEDKTAVLRVSSDRKKELWSALSLTTSFDGLPCTFQVLQTSPFLLSLACSSRINTSTAEVLIGNYASDGTGTGVGGSKSGSQSKTSKQKGRGMCDPWDAYFVE